MIAMTGIAFETASTTVLLELNTWFKVFYNDIELTITITIFSKYGIAIWASMSSITATTLLTII